jgi:hypothetical protein
MANTDGAKVKWYQQYYDVPPKNIPKIVTVSCMEDTKSFSDKNDDEFYQINFLYDFMQDGDYQSFVSLKEVSRSQKKTSVNFKPGDLIKGVKIGVDRESQVIKAVSLSVING